MIEKNGSKIKNGRILVSKTLVRKPGLGWHAGRLPRFFERGLGRSFECSRMFLFENGAQHSPLSKFQGPLRAKNQLQRKVMIFKNRYSR